VGWLLPTAQAAVAIAHTHNQPTAQSL